MVSVADRGLILVVSDDVGAVDGLRRILDDGRYELLDVEGDESPTRAALAREPDLIVVDTALAHADPFDLVADLHRNGPRRDLPVLFVAGQDDVQARVRSLEGGDDLLTTPFDPREVLARIERQVTISRVRTALRESEARYRSVMESAIDAIISADADGIICSWNGAATALFGHTEAEAVGRRLELVIPERFRGLHRDGIRRVNTGGEAHVIGSTAEFAAVRKDGTEFPIELSLATWFLDEDRYYTGIIRDIGARKAAEEALLRSERELRERGEQLRRKNAALEETLQRIGTMQDQLILQEKMASLGKLSAGMAHELNNPASAAQRGSAQAMAVFERLQLAQLQLGRLGYYGSKLERLRQLDALAAERARAPAQLSAVARSDRESDIEEWLDEHGVHSGGAIAQSLTSLGFSRDDLDGLGTTFDAAGLPAVAEWLGLKFLIYMLLSEIGVGTSRIVELVKALKTYTYLDQAPVQDVDVRVGIDNTLVILHSKLKHGVLVVREYEADLPPIQAYAGELNQVWTNLIDNAIDAMHGEGTLTLRARRDADWIEVQVEDDGPGVPPDIRSKLFDPFFTTKPQGEGTGLGLPISWNLVVGKHHGVLDVDSRPGCTRFIVRLPIDLVPSDESREAGPDAPGEGDRWPSEA